MRKYKVEVSPNDTGRNKIFFIKAQNLDRAAQVVDTIKFDFGNSPLLVSLEPTTDWVEGVEELATGFCPNCGRSGCRTEKVKHLRMCTRCRI